jgi:hypothetical protein
VDDIVKDGVDAFSFQQLIDDESAWKNPFDSFTGVELEVEAWDGPAALEAGDCWVGCKLGRLTMTGWKVARDLDTRILAKISLKLKTEWHIFVSVRT